MQNFSFSLSFARRILYKANTKGFLQVAPLRSSSPAHKGPEPVIPLALRRGESFNFFFPTHSDPFGWSLINQFSGASKKGGQATRPGLGPGHPDLTRSLNQAPEFPCPSVTCESGRPKVFCRIDTSLESILI